MFPKTQSSFNTLMQPDQTQGSFPAFFCFSHKSYKASNAGFLQNDNSKSHLTRPPPPPLMPNSHIAKIPTQQLQCEAHPENVEAIISEF
jgi:hypothetical protein